MNITTNLKEVFNMKKAIVLLAKGFEEVEALTVVDVLRRGEIHCITCSINDYEEVVGTHNIHVKVDNLLGVVTAKRGFYTLSHIFTKHLYI